jgi:prepilin-type N-terminal cleavage/methylation domain-containing protein
VQKTVKKTQKGFTLIELLIVIAVIAILAAIAIPNLLSSRKAANESSAISSVRTLITAEETYRSRYGTYTATIGDLGPAPSSGPTKTAAGLVDSLLAAGTKSGYTMAVAAPATGTIATGYTITANPVTPGTTGDRYFKADETGVLKSADSAAGTFLAIQ